MDKSLISIIMPMKNAGSFLDPCIQSILNQKQARWELIIVDDHSTDLSYKRALKYSHQHDNIQVVKSKTHGIPGALSTGYELAQGDIIHRMDADDLMPEEKLSILKFNLRKGHVSTGKVEYFSDEKLGEGYKRYAKDINNVLDENLIHKHLFRECFLPSPNWMMYREDFDSIGGFHPTTIPEDYDLFFRVFFSGLPFSVVPKVTHLWRDSPGRTSRIDDNYQQLKFIPLKVFYFEKHVLDKNRPLILWGAGKKGKAIAKNLIDDDVDFDWITNNQKKLHVPIYHKRLNGIEFLRTLNNPQIILSVAGPEDKKLILQELNKLELQDGIDYWWFC